MKEKGFMNTILKLTFAMVLLTTWSVNAASVWKVTHGKNTTYIGGTIHLLKEESFPLPSEYDKAYGLSDKLVFETDIDATQTPEFQQRALGQFLLTDGSKMENHLSPSTFQALKRYLSSKGIPIENFQPLKPAAVALTISVLEFQANGFLQQGVDQYYTSKAKADGKAQSWLESVDEQLGLITNLGKGEDDQMIKYTLEDLDELPQYLDKLLHSWKSGDLNEMETFMINDMKREAPDMYKAILVDRNNNWIPKITNMLNDKQTEFVLVGVAHLAGEDSVLKKLEAKGYKVEKL
jgi:uncharacterized protein YbaP (TraB family)